MNDDHERMDEPARTEAGDEERAYERSLQQELSSLRWLGWRGGGPELPAAVAPPAPATWRRRAVLASAAAALLLAVGVGSGLFGPDDDGAEQAYPVAVLAGAPELPGDGRRPLRDGDQVVTPAGAQVRLTIGALGSVRLDEGSRLRVERPRGGAARHRLHLEEGALSAFITAPPRLFELGTPSGTAVDLGCAYDAVVEADGRTRLTVTLGAVAFESEPSRVYVPRGASVWAWPGVGPGTPVRDAASPALRDAVRLLDDPTIDATVKHQAREVLRAEVRPADSLSVWHLMARADGELRFWYGKLLHGLVPRPEVGSFEDAVDPRTEAGQAWLAQQPWLGIGGFRG